MTAGIIGLAVPGSSAFAGEFEILAGVFSRGWGYSVVGAVAIVLAAMYMLRLISAVLHRDPGPAVSPEALDLRPAELGAIVPLLACLLALSVWPAAITERSFTHDQANTDVSRQFAVAEGTNRIISVLTVPSQGARGTGETQLNGSGQP
jgi:NADH:ubiquinone oxidoreductase subunit 4 (subunit M)